MLPIRKSLDNLVAVALVGFVALIALFPLRNNDVWWHLAVGEALLRGHHFIRTDPFTFTLAGTSWVPHAWLSDIGFYLVHARTSMWGLVVVRAILVAGIFAALLRLLHRLGVSITLAAPVVIVAALNAHSRFILRPHLIEYLFIVLLLGHLLTRGGHRGARFFVFPVVLQALWVNLHASFYTGPLLVALFYAGEFLSKRIKSEWGRNGVLAEQSLDGGRVVMLLVFMVMASFLNPSPIPFLFQPLNAEHRELLTRYTLEWRSPFGAQMAGAAFHPYYEILLAFVAGTLLWSRQRLRISSLLIVAFFGALSLEAHRFRVEFALVAVPLMLDQLRLAPATGTLGKKLAGGGTPARRGLYGGALALAALLVFTSRDRVEIGSAVSDRFPEAALDFIRDEGIAHRPFHGIGTGSYLIGKLYPERKAFIDGRNFNASLYREFLACQTNTVGFNQVVNKYRLDAFILPVPAKSDGGMRNLHRFLVEAKNWKLVYLDRNAYVYVKRGTVPRDWLEAFGYRFYHPITFARMRFSSVQVDSVLGELRRAVDTDPRYMRPLLDLGRFHAAMGQPDAARERFTEALRIDPESREARQLLKSVPGQGRQ